MVWARVLVRASHQSRRPFAHQHIVETPCLGIGAKGFEVLWVHGGVRWLQDAELITAAPGATPTERDFWLQQPVG